MCWVEGTILWLALGGWKCCWRQKGSMAGHGGRIWLFEVRRLAADDEVSLKPYTYGFSLSLILELRLRILVRVPSCVC